MNFSLPLLPGPFWPGVVVHVRVPSWNQIDLSKNYAYSVGLFVTISPCAKKKQQEKKKKENNNKKTAMQKNKHKKQPE